jgi:hypothetical protein
MSSWGRRTYGEPCRDCGFSWKIDRSQAELLVAGLNSRLAQVLAHASGTERHPALEWPVTSYVAHIGDNLRIWAERLAGITLGGSSVVTAYDQDALARARTYDSISLPGALWTLEHSVSDWLEAVGMASSQLTMNHPHRGELSLEDVIQSNAHDAVHHEWDIKRSLGR